MRCLGRYFWQVPVGQFTHTRPRDPRPASGTLRGTGVAWEVSEKSLNKTFVFKEFTEAFAFMTEVAKIAEELDHHPDWSNSWNTVEISITNHQAGGITEIDLYLCARIEETVNRWGK